MKLKTLLTTDLENINRKNDCSMLIFKDAFKKKTQYLPRAWFFLLICNDCKGNQHHSSHFCFALL